MPYAVAPYLPSDIPLANTLFILCSVLWLITYVLTIFRSWKDKVAGFPWPATCFNLAWEFYFAFLSDVATGISLVLIRAWLALDLVIFYLELRFGKKQQQEMLRRRFFHVSVFLMLLTAVLTEYTFISFNNDTSGTQTALVINLLMAVLFVSLLFNHPDGRGLSLPAAWAMTLGTGLNSVGLFILGKRAFPGHDDIRLIYVLCVGIFIFNILYIAGLTVAKREQATA